MLEKRLEKKLEKNREVFWHFLALFVVIVWGTTLASTKVLLADMSPIQILLYRSLFAYGLLFAMSPRLRTFSSVKNEVLYFLSGLCGITLYFLLENTALLYTYSSNAALLVTASPLFTVLIASFIIKTHTFSKLLLIACVMALVGVALVLANQPMNLTNGMLGNILAILSGLAWSLFGFANSAIKDELSPMVRMRKVFLYGIITASLYMLVTGEAFINLHAFTPINLANLLFLGGIASALCFVLWTNANKHLGVVKTSLYIYFIPFIAVLLGVVLLGETITISTILGGILIALAVFLANYKKSVS